MDRKSIPSITGVIKLLVTRNPCSVLNCSNCRCALTVPMTVSLCPSAVCMGHLSAHDTLFWYRAFINKRHGRSRIQHNSYIVSFQLSINYSYFVCHCSRNVFLGLQKLSGCAGALATIPIPFSDGCCLQLRAI